jgi:heme exporter protein D
MDAISSFFFMGGYWPYVWPAFAVAGLVLGGLWVVSWRAMRASEARLASADPRHRERAQGDTSGDAP